MKDPKQRFSSAASLYHKYRPSYPGALLDWIFGTAKLKAADPVADVGCGTGISSRLLADRGLLVTGVDPNDEMLAFARDQKRPNLTFLKGAAEDTGLPASTFGAVTVAQAFHWFDVEPTLREFARILRPGGRVVVFWNLRTTGPMNDDYDALLRRFSTEYGELNKAAEDNVNGTRTELRVKGSKQVRDLQQAEFTNQQALGWEGFLGRVFSSSYVQHGVQDPEGLKQALRAHFDRHSSGGQLTITYRVEAWSFGLAAQ